MNRHRIITEQLPCDYISFQIGTGHIMCDDLQVMKYSNARCVKTPAQPGQDAVQG